MENKRLHIIFVIFLMAGFCAISLLFMGCYDIDKIFYGTDSEYEHEREKEAEREAAEQTAEEVTETEVEQSEQTEEVATAEEDSLTSKTVTYNGNMEGLAIIFIVNFNTTEVTGSLESPVIGLPDYVFTDGKVDLDTLEVTARSTGPRELDSDGNVIQTQDFIITGTISGDLSTINGVIANNFDESFEFIAIK